MNLFVVVTSTSALVWVLKCRGLIIKPQGRLHLNSLWCFICRLLGGLSGCLVLQKWYLFFQDVFAKFYIFEHFLQSCRFLNQDLGHYVMMGKTGQIVGEWKSCMPFLFLDFIGGGIQCFPPPQLQFLRGCIVFEVAHLGLEFSFAASR